jgi:hypothetical protein
MVASSAMVLLMRSGRAYSPRENAREDRVRDAQTPHTVLTILSTSRLRLSRATEANYSPFAAYDYKTARGDRQERANEGWESFNLCPGLI